MEHSPKVNSVHKSAGHSVSDRSQISTRSLFLRNRFPYGMVVHTKPKDGLASDQEDIEADSIADDILDKGTLAAPIPSSVAEGGREVPEEVTGLMQSSKGAAAPDNVKMALTDIFKRDFSQLTLHTDDNAAKANEHLMSRAFSIKDNIFFNQREYDPESKEGQQLLLHESAHIAESEGEVKKELTIDEKIKSGMILSTSEIMNLTTRRQRAEYLFTPDKNQSERGKYVFKNQNAVEDALTKRRIYSSEDDASADMETLKLDVIGDGGKIFTLRMKVHYKLSDYVRTMFQEILEAYSVSDSVDNFVFDENDKNGGAYNWRYSRMDKIYNLERIEALEDEIKDIGLDDEVLAKINDEVRRGAKASAIDINQLKESIAIDKYEQLLSIEGSEDSEEYKSIENDIRDLGLSTEILDKAKSIAEMPEADKKQIEAKSKQRKNFLIPIKKEYENKTKNARNKFKSIIGYEKKNLSIDSTTQKKQDKIDKLEDEIIQLKSEREKLIGDNRSIEQKNAIITGLKKGQKVSEATQAEIDRITGETAESVYESEIQGMRTILDEKKKQYELYKNVQTKRNQLPLIDLLEEKNELNSKSSLRIRKDTPQELIEEKNAAKAMYDAYCKSPGDLASDIEILGKEIQGYSDLIATYEASDPEEVKNGAIDKLLARKIEEEREEKFLEENNTEKELNKLKTKSTNNTHKLDQKISNKAREIENLYKDMPAYQATRFSEHSAGIAIDINPKTNPQYAGFDNAPNLYIKGEIDKEENQKYFSKKYKDKIKEEAARKEWHDEHLGKDRYTLKPNSKIVQIFKKYGWKWGGEWTTRDYMHFEWFSKTWPEN